ncbi:MAG: hypothetical protein EU544_05150, partial [Promethearchaeota archaeon]
GIIVSIALGFSIMMLNSVVAYFVNLLVNYLIGFLYFFLLEYFTEGKTIGKAIFKLRTVEEDTFETPPPGSYALNNITKANLIFLLIDLLIGLVTQDGQQKNQYRYFQTLSKTVVIKE